MTGVEKAVGYPVFPRGGGTWAVQGHQGKHQGPSGGGGRKMWVQSLYVASTGSEGGSRVIRLRIGWFHSFPQGLGRKGCL